MYKNESRECCQCGRNTIFHLLFVLCKEMNGEEIEPERKKEDACLSVHFGMKSERMVKECGKR